MLFPPQEACENRILSELSTVGVNVCNFWQKLPQKLKNRKNPVLYGPKGRGGVGDYPLDELFPLSELLNHSLQLAHFHIRLERVQREVHFTVEIGMVVPLWYSIDQMSAWWQKWRGHWSAVAERSGSSTKSKTYNICYFVAI